MDKTLEKIYNRLDFNSPLILAVSGGKDSVAMLHMAMAFKDKFKIKPEVIHFNHGIRKESDEEEKFVKKLCQKYGIKLKIFKFDTYALKEKEGLSLEEAARTLRYKTLEKYTSGKNEKGYIYTAHTASDQAETLLFRLVKGAGRAGMSGIREIRLLDSGWKVKRPLLNLTKEDVLEYIEKNNIKHITDKSNFDSSIPRNFIRSKIIPLLKEINPSVENNIKKLADIFEEEEKFINSVVLSKLKNVKSRRKEDKIYIELRPIISYNKWLRRRIIRKVAPVQLKYEQTEQILNLISKEGSSKFIELCDGWKARKSYGEIIFEKDSPVQVDFSYKISVNGEKDIHEAGAVLKTAEISPDEVGYGRDTVEYFDLDKITADDLWVRSRKPGDRMSLFGMKGSKKIKDLCIDLKLGILERNNLLLVGSGEKIIWAAPRRRSAVAPITEKTEKVLKIKYEKK